MAQTRMVSVDGLSYSVQEKAGYLKAHLNGTFGWASVWADSYTQLVRRIRWALAGKQ
jgi:hypothetical protein